jgi:hypothetical protein
MNFRGKKLSRQNQWPFSSFEFLNF